MRAPALSSLLLMASTAACVTPSGYHDVAGWPGWSCADAPGEPGQSVWYETERGQRAAALYEGSCGSWAKRPGQPREALGSLQAGPPTALGLGTGSGAMPTTPTPEPGDNPEDPQAAAPPPDTANLGKFRQVKGWTGWLCADYTDNRDASLWYQETETIDAATVFDGKCESWVQ